MRTENNFKLFRIAQIAVTVRHLHGSCIKDLNMYLFIAKYNTSIHPCIHTYNDILSHSVFELWVKGGLGAISHLEWVKLAYLLSVYCSGHYAWDKTTKVKIAFRKWFQQEEQLGGSKMRHVGG